MYTSNFFDANLRSDAIFLPKIANPIRKSVSTQIATFLLFSVWLYVIGLKFITEIDIYGRFITGISSWASHFCWAARQKIEKFIFTKFAKQREFLTQNLRRSANSRPKFASVHGPLGPQACICRTYFRQHQKYILWMFRA